jgi:hypothetical protein
MSNLVRKWNDINRKHIAEMLYSLYIYHAIYATKESVMIQVKDLEETGNDPDLIAIGIKTLKDGPQLQKISVPMILEAMREKVPLRVPEPSDCICGCTGIITMVEVGTAYAYTTAIACKCEKGANVFEAFKRKGSDGKIYSIGRWNGQMTQEFKGQLYELDWMYKKVIEREQC